MAERMGGPFASSRWVLVRIMIELPCKQGSVEWHEARLGIPTASEFRRIVTPRGNRSSSRVMPTGGSCLAEWALGEPVGGFTGTEDTERGPGAGARRPDATMPS